MLRKESSRFHPKRLYLDVNNPFTITLESLYAPKKKKKKKKKERKKEKTKTGERLNVTATKMIMLTPCCAESLLISSSKT